MRLADSDFKGKNAFASFDKSFALRQREADEFYATVIPQDLSADAQNVMRQGFAGMLWSKQFYHYIIKDWLQGDPGNPPPPQERRKGRNNTLEAGPDDPGSPWAIGGAKGGHTAIEPSLGTLEEFRAVVTRAHELGMEIADAPRVVHTPQRTDSGL